MNKKQTRKFQHRKQPPASSQLPQVKLTPQDMDLLCQALVEYHRLFHSCFQRREQREWSAFYLCGQLSNLERKTIEPMVLELLGPQSNIIRAVQQFIGQGHWGATTLVQRLQAEVDKTLGDPQAVLIVDGSGFPKQGEHSAGVARQYCGAVGKIANCQEGVFAVYASQHGYTFVDARLYLHESWFDAEHQQLWQACGIPEAQPFRTEPELALEMIQGIVTRAVLPFQWITCDEQFGRNPAFLDGIAALDKWYCAEVPCDTRVWLRTPAIEPPGRSLMGRARTQPRVKLNAPRTQEVQSLATAVPNAAWRTFLVQEGSKGPLRAEFALMRITTVRNRLPGPRVWAIFRRSVSTPREVKYYLSNAPTSCLPREFAHLSGMRWPVETTLEEGKGEVGMDHYETRTWCGWHHHMAHTFVAHFFLMRMRVVLKKIFSADNGAGPQFAQRNHQRAALFAQYVGGRRLLAASQPRRISITSQANTQTLSSSDCIAQKARSLVVM